MNIEKIKEYRNAKKFPAVSLGDEMLDWLIAEVEKYQKLVAGNGQAQVDWVDATARRCIAIASGWGCHHLIVRDIRKEFNLED